MEELKNKTIKRIKKNKKKLGEKLNVKITLDGNKAKLEGEELNKFIARQVLRAIDRNFKLSEAILLKEEDYSLQDIPIKEYTTRKDLSNVKSRIIGREAKTIQLLNELSECYKTLHYKVVSILEPYENMKETINAIKKLIQGSDHSKVYKYLEKERAKLKNKPRDVGLKKSFKKKLEKIKEEENK